MDSILNTIKKMLGLSEDYTAFDVDIINDINSAFFTLFQLAVGPSVPFSISDAEDIWSDFTGGATDIEAIKQYIYLHVKRTFDPPTSSFVSNSIDNQIKELEWRLNVYAEYD